MFLTADLLLSSFAFAAASLIQSLVLCSVQAAPLLLYVGFAPLAAAAGILAVFWRSFLYRAGFLSSCLGCVFACGAFVGAVGSSALSKVGAYVATMAFFHWSEFAATALANPAALKLDSFLLNHSREYWLAALVSWLEFGVEWRFFAGSKAGVVPAVVSLAGLALCLFGESVRKTAMLTAGSNFTHLISYEKRAAHVLVTSGVYSRWRHPSYVGWFYWSIGTQLLLCNPVCSVAYGVVSWRFFRARIADEEESLLRFFGDQYERYRQVVPTGMEPLAKQLQTVLDSVEGLCQMFVSDREGVPVMRASSAHSPETFLRPQLLTAYQGALEQTAKLGVGAQQHMVCEYGNFQVVLLNMSPLTVTMIATSSANTGLLIGLRDQLQPILERVEVAVAELLPRID